MTGREGGADPPGPLHRPDAPPYAELQVTTHFSFLRGASGCEELFAAAADRLLPFLNGGHA